MFNEVPETPKALGLPSDAWKGDQRQVLQRMRDSQARVLLCSAPTGSGKSYLAMGLIRMLGGRGYVLTSTQQLQDQYIKEFETPLMVTGRRNHRCILRGFEDTTVDKALCQTGWKCSRKFYCPYYQQIENARAAGEVILNYDMWLSSSLYSGNFRSTGVLVADEAHLMEHHVVSYETITISYKDYSHWDISVPNHGTIERYAGWANDVYATAMTVYQDQQRSLNQLLALAGDNPQRDEAIDELSQQVRTLSNITGGLARLRTAPTQGSWLIRHREGREAGLEFVPLWAKSACERIYLTASQKVLLMSATLLPSPKTAERLGLKPGEYEFIEVPSTFSPSLAPIFPRYVGTLNKDNLQEKLPQIVETVDDIIEDHLPERGIVHSHTNAIRDYILEHSRFTNQMVSHRDGNRKQVIKNFLALDGPPVLVSPSVMTGLDGKDDAARFQVIVKHPYPSLGDALVAARAKEDRESYAYDANAAFVQACGRIIRDESDHGATYALDGNFSRMMQRWPKHFPTWLRRRIVYN